MTDGFVGNVVPKVRGADFAMKMGNELAGAVGRTRQGPTSGKFSLPATTTPNTARAAAKIDGICIICHGSSGDALSRTLRLRPNTPAFGSTNVSSRNSKGSLQPRRGVMMDPKRVVSPVADFRVAAAWRNQTFGVITSLCNIAYYRFSSPRYGPIPKTRPN